MKNKPKSPKKPEIDPIKAKYIKKIGFFKKIHIKLISLKNYIKSFKSKELEQITFDIILFGGLGSFALGLFGVSFTFLNFLGIGCLCWIVENKVVDLVTQILSSINLVKVYK